MNGVVKVRMRVRAAQNSRNYAYVQCQHSVPMPLGIDGCVARLTFRLETRACVLVLPQYLNPFIFPITMRCFSL